MSAFATIRSVGMRGLSRYPWNVQTKISSNLRVVGTCSFSSKVEVEHGRGVWKTYGDIENYTPGKYQIKCFNKISSVGLSRFSSDNFEIRRDGEEAKNAHAILLRSHKLQIEDVPQTVRAIAR